MNTKSIITSTLLSALTLTASAQTAVMSDTHAMQRVKTDKQYVLLPVEESMDIAHVRVIKNNQVVQEFNCRLAVKHTDYNVPLDVKAFGGDVTLDIQFTGQKRPVSSIQDYVCWKGMTTTDTFDTTNREMYRPVFHHTPLYGWMNDPNGMFYKDGVWHLYFQYNPYGSQWENMTWGHSTSTDLMHWQQQPEAIKPDGLGTIFSGSCVVDKNNTAGQGADAVVAFYTSAGISQTQSMAVSHDNGKTFIKYAGNPILTADVPDFRDPNAFWNEDAKVWNLILAAGQEMRIYSSTDLTNWKEESSFGKEYGNHGGVWECPDLMKIGDKWVLICNINPGGPFGGSATQYFIGKFDGHKFTCEDDPKTTKWLDWGKDHYATVSFDNAPEGRHVVLPWMSNWQYANQVPTQQFRSANGLPRDLGLFSHKGETYVSVLPSPEVYKAFEETTTGSLSACAYLEVTNLKSNATVTLSNDKGEQVVITYNGSKQTVSMDRTKSGKTDFSADFPCVTTASTYGKARSFQLFVDHSSLELFEGQGHVAMTNLVFPTSPYNKVTAKGCKVKIHAYRK